MNKTNDDNIDMLKAVIPTGKDNAKHQKELADIMGVSTYTFKKYVQNARRKGVNICSGNDGYWITENEAELKAFNNMLKKQALTRLKTTKPIRDSLKEYKGQLTFKDTFTSVSEEVENGSKEQNHIYS